jgi:hypothetical protein
MATYAQVNANRLNAQRSTGPRSDEGKAASRFNALKHGIDARSLVIPGEDPAHLEALALEYFGQCDPVGALERYLVETLVHDDWNRRRYTLIESQILQESPDASTERSYFRALKELRRAQKERKAQQEAQAEHAEAAAEPEIGFVLPIPQPSGAGAPACRAETRLGACSAPQAVLSLA